MKWTLKHWSTNLRGWSIILKLPIEFKHRVEGKNLSVYCFQMMALECYYEQASKVSFPASTSCLTVLLVKE